MTLRQFHVCVGIVTALLGALAVVPIGAASRGAAAAAVAGLELVMVEEAGCRFCMRWDREVGAVYDRSIEGQQVPLRRVRRGASELEGLKPVVYTPTFILKHNAREVGRITGYPGASFFWEELAALIAEVGPSPDGEKALDVRTPDSGKKPGAGAVGSPR
jgi:hypothetical protein